MESGDVDNSIDLDPVDQITTAHSDITSRISAEDKFMIEGKEYVKGSVLGGTKRGSSTSWI